MDMLQEEFVEQVNRLLESKGWTRARLAQEMHKPPQFVTNYLNSRHQAGSEVMVQFFDALGYEVHLMLVEKKAGASRVRRAVPA